MKFILPLLALFASVSAFAPLYQSTGEVVPDSYIVVFDCANEFAKQSKRSGANAFSFGGKLMGMELKMSLSEVQEAQQWAGVKYIEHNQVYRIELEKKSIEDQIRDWIRGIKNKFEDESGEHKDVTWGIDRVDQRELPLDKVYRWNNAATGVKAFVLDTGMDHPHEGFDKDNAFFGRNFIDLDPAHDAGDPHGHGTHVGGTIGSYNYGVAKLVEVYGVRVLNSFGSGTTIGIINGIEWVVTECSNGIEDKCVINMSIGGGVSAIFNAAVAEAYDSGVLSVVSSGNSYGDSCSQSPSSEPKAVSVGASTVVDGRAAYSNSGKCTEIVAPGDGILSLKSGGGTTVMSGTSMSAPHTAGAVALIWQRFAESGVDYTLEDVVQTLQTECTPINPANWREGTHACLIYTYN